MQLIVELQVKIGKGKLGVFTDELGRHGCTLRRLLLGESGESHEIYEAEIIYSDTEGYAAFMSAAGASRDSYQITGERNLLEDTIAGGLLNVSGKMRIETQADYEMRLLGSAALMREQIRKGKGDRCTGILRTVGMLGCVKKRADASAETIRLRHADLERDAAITNHFTGLNALPIIITFTQTEDLVKTIQGIEAGFAAMRITGVEDLDDSAVYEQILSEMSLPAVSTAYDEIPLLLLAEILHLLDRDHIALSEATAGIIGIECGSLRMTRILHGLGCHRVLGYDHNEKLMLTFEKAGGLATTPENIFNNSDVILLFRNHFTIDEFHRIRAGQIVISLIDFDELEMGIISEKGVRDFVSRQRIDAAVVFPGLLSGILKTGSKGIDDGKIVETARKINRQRARDKRPLSLFQNAHDLVARFLTD